MLVRSCWTFWSAPWTCASHPLSPLATGFVQSTLHDDSDVAAGSAVGADGAADEADGPANPAQLLFESEMTCPNWALMALPSVVPNLLTRAAFTCEADMLVSDAGTTDDTAIAFLNDMSRLKSPMTHDSPLVVPPTSAAVVNWLTSAAVH